MTSDPKRPCGVPRKDGQPCSVTTLLGDSLCFAHSGLTATARVDARRRGGRNSASATRLRGLVPPRLTAVYDRLERALAETHAGTLEPRTAGAIASLARAMVAVLQAGELEGRLRALERPREPFDTRAVRIE